MFPRFSILDPTKTYTLPIRQIANGVVDSFTHVMEQYLTYPADGLVQDRFAEGLLQTLIEIGPKLLEKADDYELRANFMWVATLALNGLIGAGVPQDWSTHIIGHELTARYNIDHARTLAVVLPANLQVRRTAKHGKLLQYAQRVWGITQGSEDERIDAAIDRTRFSSKAWGSRPGCPTMASTQARSGSLSASFARTAWSNSASARTSPLRWVSVFSKPVFDKKREASS
jgi:NADP-dependent alcohol dehydrogenase